MKLSRHLWACLCALVFASCGPDLSGNGNGSGSEDSGSQDGTADKVFSFTIPEGVSGTRPSEDHYARVTVELRSKESDEMSIRFSDTVNLKNLSNVDIPHVKDGKYDLLAWVDCFSTAKDVKPFYDVADLRGVSFDDDGYADCDIVSKTAYYVCEKDVLIEGDKNLDFTLKCPHGGYKVVLENPGDVMELDKKGYTAVVTYSAFLPSSFNVYMERTSDSHSGVSYTMDISEIKEDTASLCIAEDVVLCGESGAVGLVISIMDDSDNVVCQSAQLNIDLQRGAEKEVKVDQSLFSLQ